MAFLNSKLNIQKEKNFLEQHPLKEVGLRLILNESKNEIQPIVIKGKIENINWIHNMIDLLKFLTNKTYKMNLTGIKLFSLIRTPINYIYDII